MKMNDELLFAKRYKVTNLLPGSTYEFKMEATNEAGLTSDSGIVSESLTLSATICNFYLIKTYF